jgi:hypothetical protein
MVPAGKTASGGVLDPSPVDMAFSFYSHAGPVVTRHSSAAPICADFNANSSAAVCIDADRASAQFCCSTANATGAVFPNFADLRGWFVTCDTFLRALPEGLSGYCVAT